MLLRFGDNYIDPARITSAIIVPPEDQGGKGPRGKGKPPPVGTLLVGVAGEDSIPLPLDAPGVEDLRGWLAANSQPAKVESASPAPAASAPPPATAQG